MIQNCYWLLEMVTPSLSSKVPHPCLTKPGHCSRCATSFPDASTYFHKIHKTEILLAMKSNTKKALYFPKNQQLRKSKAEHVRFRWSVLMKFPISLDIKTFAEKDHRCQYMWFKNCESILVQSAVPIGKVNQVQIWT